METNKRYDKTKGMIYMLCIISFMLNIHTYFEHGFSFGIKNTLTETQIQVKKMSGGGYDKPNASKVAKYVDSVEPELLFDK